MLTHIDIEEIHRGQKDIYQSIIDYRQEDAHNHARMFQEQLDMRTQLSEFEIINLLRIATASLANGGIHKRCMKNTRRKILAEIENWHLDPFAPQILWLADVAGSGKSTVTKEVAEKCPLQEIQTPIILVLDALDECEPKTCQQLLEVLLPNLYNLPHLKLFLTSRPKTHIRQQLNNLSPKELSLRAEHQQNGKLG
ncbi:hypothetical protein CPB86DRAFT_820590 [Serendipita vermifera]|nr:hypothetical protein CPB86DRAFT_820590 [Serendipita vermifera]